MVDLPGTANPRAVRRIVELADRPQQTARDRIEIPVVGHRDVVMA